MQVRRLRLARHEGLPKVVQRRAGCASWAIQLAMRPMQRTVRLAEDYSHAMPPRRRLTRRFVKMTVDSRLRLDEHQQPLKLSPASRRDLAHKKQLLRNYDWSKGGVGLKTPAPVAPRLQVTNLPSTNPQDGFSQVRRTSQMSQIYLPELPKLPALPAQYPSSQNDEDADDISDAASSFDASQLLSSRNRDVLSPLPRYSDGDTPNDHALLAGGGPSEDIDFQQPQSQPGYAASISSSDLFLKLTPQYDMLFDAPQPQQPVLSRHTSRSGSESVFDAEQLSGAEHYQRILQVSSRTTSEQSERESRYVDDIGYDCRLDDTVLAEDSQLPPHTPNQDVQQPITLSFLPDPYNHMTHISQIQSEPLELPFYHPCMVTVEGFPAVYRPIRGGPRALRDEEKKKKESGKRQDVWPWCLKQMWEMEDLPHAGGLMAIEG